MVNYDLRQIVEWLRVNKILLNSGKTEVVLFRSKNKKFTLTLQKINIF